MDLIMDLWIINIQEGHESYEVGQLFLMATE